MSKHIYSNCFIILLILIVNLSSYNVSSQKNLNSNNLNIFSNTKSTNKVKNFHSSYTKVSNSKEKSCYDGSYQVTSPPFNSCSGFRDCEIGYYCKHYKKYLCPAGTYGNEIKLETEVCSGKCPAGFYCPAGTTNPYSHDCGEGNYCPSGSIKPIKVPHGYYSIDNEKKRNPDNKNRRTSIIICPKGSYCIGGEKFLCPAGTYGNQEGLKDKSCSGSCPVGYYCPAGLINPFSFSCSKNLIWKTLSQKKNEDYKHDDLLKNLNQFPSQFYCPVNSTRPQALTYGYYLTKSIESKYNGGGFTGELPCPIGSYCPYLLNSVISEPIVKPIPCPPGRYGSVKLETKSTCSGECEPGYYCPAGSISPTQNSCLSYNLYCPAGSSHPKQVDPGYYSIGAPRRIGSSSRNLIKPDGFVSEDPSGAPLKSIPIPTSDPYEVYFEEELQVYDNHYHRIDENGIQIKNSTHKHLYIHSVDDSLYSYLDFPYYHLNKKYRILKGVHRVGQAICELGHYCQNGIKFRCPAGTFGNSTGLTSGECSGICPAGFYCPIGTIDPIPCHHYLLLSHKDKTVEDLITSGLWKTVFCPSGSNSAIPVTPGYYTSHLTVISGTPSISTFTKLSNTHLNTTGGMVIEIPCEPGHYCKDGVRYDCPSGYFGSKFQEINELCEGLCLPGYYCPSASFTSTPAQCGDPVFYCPEGSQIPTPVPEGYYSIGGNYTTRFNYAIAPRGFYASRGILFPCPSGYYGDKEGMSNPACSGLCDIPGFYCPPASTSKKMRVCSSITLASDIINPLIMLSSLSSSKSHTSTINMIQDWLRTDGWMFFNNYNDNTIFDASMFNISFAVDFNSSSSYSKSLTPTLPSPFLLENLELGDNYYCPIGSPAPTKVESGYYTADYRYEECPPGMWRDFTFKDQYYTDLPFSAIPRFDISTCELCPIGTYKEVHGDSKDLCKPCDPSVSTPLTPEDPSYIYLPVLSSPNRISCICNTIFKEGYVDFYNSETSTCSKLPIHELPLINHDRFHSNTSLTRYETTQCEPGYFCVHGKRFRCPGGYYGSLYRETRPLCSGLCSKGFFCMTGSTSPQSQPCGAANLICPEGSSTPTLVPPGYYSQEDVSPKFRYEMFECPPGYYCPGDGYRYKCPAGHYGRDSGLISPKCNGLCEKGHYCKEGSSNPRQYQCGGSNYYCQSGSSEPTLASEGFYTAHSGDNAGELALWDVKNMTMSVEIICEPGYYCTKGIKYPCPPGQYGWQYGLSSFYCNGKCAAGYYCPSYLTRQGNVPDYTVFPGKPHVIANEYKCGNNNYYCPAGSFYPIAVDGGYYSIGGDYDNSTRVSQEICPKGYYCIDAIKFPCPAGRFGKSLGLTTDLCSGACPAGFECPSATITPSPCPFNTYSVGMAGACSPCPSERTTPMKCQDDNSCCLRI